VSCRLVAHLEGLEAVARKAKPPAVACRGSCQIVVRRTGLPVALSAEQEEHSVLILELVRGRSSRFADSVAAGDGRAFHFLIQMGVGQISREGQVLDWRPPRDETKLPDVVIGIAGGYPRTEGALERTSHSARSADQILSLVIII